MERKVASFAATPDPTYGRPRPQANPDGAAGPEDAGAADEPDLRLVIEGDDADGPLIYRIVDRRTGAVIQQFLREEVLQMREDADYSAGGVISTKA